MDTKKEKEEMMKKIVKEDKEVLQQELKASTMEGNTVEITTEVEVVETAEPKKEATSPVQKEEVKTEKTESVDTRRNARGQSRNKDGQQRRPRRFSNRRVSEFKEQVVDLSRVTTVVKGGRRFSFSAIVVSGNGKGKVGVGHGKAKEVPDAIKKAVKDSQSNLVEVPIVNGGTVPHEIEVKYLSSKVLLKPAKKGKGIIASGAVRSVVELAGYKNIYTKSLGSRNKTTTVKATIKALTKLRKLEEVAALRDIKPEEVLGR